MYLIERLEAERQYAEETLLKERKTKRFLESQVDGMSLWKQQERSQVVQKGRWCHLQPHFRHSQLLIVLLLAAVAPEHEACHRDMAELERQLKVARGELDRAREKLAESEAPNQRLREDISFTREQIRIARENLERQRGLVNQMQVAQSEVPPVCPSSIVVGQMENVSLRL